jgi:hypothetical protein
VPSRQPKRGRRWLADGSCVRLRPERPNHAWSYDFVEHRTRDGRRFRMLNVIDAFTHERLAIRVGRKLKAVDVIDVLSGLSTLRGVPGRTRPDDGPEFAAKAVRRAGSRRWVVPRRPASRRAAHGRIDTRRRSTPASATSCWTARSSTARARPRR